MARLHVTITANTRQLMRELKLLGARDGDDLETILARNKCSIVWTRDECENGIVMVPRLTHG